MKLKLLLVFLIISLSKVAFARTDCPRAKVVNIQIEGMKVMYVQNGAPWRTLGYLDKNNGTKERYSALLAALASGSDVLVGYAEDNYDCSKTNYGTEAYIVRVYSN